MTAAQPNPIPDVPLPAGADADRESWAAWDNHFRIFYGVDRLVLDETGNKVCEVRTEGIQRLDGTVESSEYPPSVDVFVLIDDGLTPAQARSLAALMVEAAAEVEGWTR